MYSLGEGRLGWEAEAGELSGPIKVHREAFLRLQINRIRLGFHLNRDQPIGAPEFQVEARIIEECVHGLPDLADIGEARNVGILLQQWQEQRRKGRLVAAVERMGWFQEVTIHDSGGGVKERLDREAMVAAGKGVG